MLMVVMILWGVLLGKSFAEVYKPSRHKPRGQLQAVNLKATEDIQQNSQHAFECGDTNTVFLLLL